MHALWEALEFYAAETTVPKMFSKQQRKDLIAAIPVGFDAVQTARLTDAINSLNRPTTVEQLRIRMRQDGIQLTDDEQALLFRHLRDPRNDLAHGRAIQSPPTREQLDRGIGLVARMLVTRLARGGSSV